MTGTGSARGGLGWVILVIALAAPGVFFYNWWSNLKADREKLVAAKARDRVPNGGVFQSSPNAKLVNPMTPAVSTETAPAPAVAFTEATRAIAVTAQAAIIGATSIASAPSAGLPRLKRDPTLSPLDVRIIEAEEARRKAERLAAIQAAKPKPEKKGPRPQKNPVTLVTVQGIVSNPENGFKAIVNDEVLGAGEFVVNTKIKVVKINDSGVTFEYQGKRFSKGVSRD